MSTNSRKQCTGGERCDVHTLADAIYCALHHSGPPLKEIALTVGARPGLLMDAANPDREDTQLQTRLVAPITRVAQNDAIIEQLARDCGGVFVRMPVLTGAHADIAQQCTRVLRKVCEAIEASTAALDSGASGATVRELRHKEIDEAIAALLGLKTVGDAAVDGAAPVVAPARKARRA